MALKVILIEFFIQGERKEHEHLCQWGAALCWKWESPVDKRILVASLTPLKWPWGSPPTLTVIPTTVHSLSLPLQRVYILDFYHQVPTLSKSAPSSSCVTAFSVTSTLTYIHPTSDRCTETFSSPCIYTVRRIIVYQNTISGQNTDNFTILKCFLRQNDVACLTFQTY